MINKTSDKNVGSIEDDVKRCNELIKVEHANWIGISNQLAISHILAEREQDKKRIKELEEENAMLKKADNIARDVNIEEVTEVMNKSYEEFMSNYINKQKVIDVMENETINISGFECVTVEDLEKLLEDK